MANIVSGIDYGLLFAANATAQESSTAILGALYGAGRKTSAISTGNPLVDLKLAQKNQASAIAREAKDPEVARDIAAFEKGIAQAATIDQALANPNVLKVLLTANGLASQLPYPALAKKVLLSDPTDSKSLVNKLGNNAWLAMVKTTNFAKNGLTQLQNPEVRATLTSGYAEVKWRQALDQATPGLSNALAFLDKASTLASYYDILGDPVGRAVVTTALGIPKQIAFQELTAQVTAVSSRLDVKKLQDPKFVQTLTNRYLLAMQQEAQANASTGQADLISLASRSPGLVV